ncbi:MAG: hypothetical protein AB7O62_10085 [Pirellulales bacterium]
MDRPRGTYRLAEGAARNVVAPKLAEQPATVAVISDPPDRPPATAMQFEHAADDDTWAGWGLRARWTCKSHVGAQSQTLTIVPERRCL